MKAAMLRDDHPLDLVAMDLPSFPAYRNLAERGSLTLIGGDIGLIWLDESGVVEFEFEATNLGEGTGSA